MKRNRFFELAQSIAHGCLYKIFLVKVEFAYMFVISGYTISRHGMYAGFGWRHLQCLQIIVERFLAGRVVEIGVFAHEILIEDVMLIVFVETLYQKGHIMFLLGTEFFGII